MFSSGRGAHLAGLRRAGSQQMAIGADQPFSAAMFRVAKGKTKSSRIGRGASVRFLIMTNSARSNFFTRLSFAAWGVAGVTLVMRRDTPGNPKRRRAPTGSAVAGGTAGRWPGSSSHVLRVIELDVEALVELRGKSFQRGICAVDVRMADDTHRNIGSNKLGQMAAGARLVSRDTRRGGIIAALVTGVAGKRCVTLTRVLEV